MDIKRVSGFVFKQITKSTIRLSRTNQLRANSYFPHDLGLRTSILNIRNTDQKCFAWSILAKIFPPERNNHTTRVLNYTPYESHLNMDGVEYPVKIQDIPKFETQNEGIAINVFALQKSNDINILYPTYMANHRNRRTEIDLLYLEKDGNTHYCLIKDLNSLFSINGNRASVCRDCVIIFTSVEALRNHQEICTKHNYCKVMEENGVNMEGKIFYFTQLYHMEFLLSNLDLDYTEPSENCKNIIKEIEKFCKTVIEFGEKNFN